MALDWLRNPAPGRACTVIGEVAQAHDGSLGMAHAYIDAIASAGAGAVKFQTHIASAESSPDEPWRVRFSRQDATRQDYWRRMEFTREQWQGLKEHATARGLSFLSSPFSLAAVELLEGIGVTAWKVASGEVANPVLLDAMLETGRPMLLSTGMSPMPEIDAAVGRIERRKRPLAVLQCTSQYPCTPERVGLNLIPLFRERYGCAVGLSDHSGTIYAGLAAATIGVELIEVHVTLSREMSGPDVEASVTTAELRQLVEGVRFIERARAHPVDKQAVPDDIAELRRLFMQSVVAAVDLCPGTVLEPAHLSTRKPGSGIPAQALPRLLGRRVCRAVARGSKLSEEDIEPCEANGHES